MRTFPVLDAVDPETLQAIAVGPDIDAISTSEKGSEQFNNESRFNLPVANVVLVLALVAIAAREENLGAVACNR